MNYNHVGIMGIVSKEPEFKVTPSGLNNCQFFLAVDQSYQGKDGNMVEKNMLIKVNLWAKLADEASLRLSAMTSIIVSGTLKQESWKDKDGNPKSMIAIHGTGVTYFEEAPVEKTTTDKVLEAFPGKLKNTVGGQPRPTSASIDLPDELPF
jgi:single stranded DNA-binding protein